MEKTEKVLEKISSTTTASSPSLMPSASSSSSTSKSSEFRVVDNVAASSFSFHQKLVKHTMKTILPINEFAKRNNKTAEDLVRENMKKYDHDEGEFITICSCEHCLNFRVKVSSLTDADRNSNIMWRELKKSLLKFYRPIFQKFANFKEIGNAYAALLDDPKLHWLVTGPMTDSIFLQAFHTMDKVTFSDKFLFIVFIGIMGKYDSYQLLELLTHNIKCVCNLYAENLQAIIDKGGNNLPAKEFITLLVSGSDELTEISRITTPIIYVFEVHYLRKFGIWWYSLHKRIYQKLVYIKFAGIVLKCLVKLKNQKEEELFQRYLEFDVDICRIEFQWETIWDKLDEYNRSQEQRSRFEQLEAVFKSFMKLQQESLPIKHGIIPQNMWKTHENRDLVWRNILQHIRKCWPLAAEERTIAKFFNEKCEKCKNYLDIHGNNCDCVTCVIAGPKRFLTKENNENKLCSKCSNITGYSELFPGKKLFDHIAKSVFSEENFHCLKGECFEDGFYHISWAVFKRLNGRHIYPFRTLKEKYFCTNCDNHTCWIARMVLSNKITKKLSMYLIDCYIDIPVEQEDVMQMLSEIMLCITKLRERPTCVDKEFEDDEICMYFWTTVITLFVKCFSGEVPNNSGVDLSKFELVANITPCIIQGYTHDIQVKKDSITGYDDSFLIRHLLYKMGIKHQLEVSLADEINFLKKPNNSKLPSIPDDEEDLEEPIIDLKNISANFTDKHVLKENPKIPNDQLPESTITSEVVAENYDENPYETPNDESIHKTIVDKNVSEPLIENNPIREESLRRPSPVKEEDEELDIRRSSSRETNDDEEEDESQPQGSKDLREEKKKKKDHKHSSGKKRSKKDCSHARANETRDRLRQKLNAIHKNAHNANIKTPVVAAAAIPASSPITSKENEEKINKICEGLNEIKIDPSKPMLPLKAIKQNSKSEEKLEEDNQPDTPESGSSIGNSRTSSIGLSCALNQMSIQETLSFIEGSSDKFKKPIDDKKAAKKAKQKLKKEESKRISQLHELREQFHEIYFKEFILKDDVKKLKSLRTRNRKKILELDCIIKKLCKTKAMVEAVILNNIQTIKITNSEFKFSYLPTKEDQQIFLKIRSEHDETSLRRYKATHPPSPPPPTQNPPSPVPMVRCETPPIPIIPPSVETIDPAKRMVTIRRVNVPNVSEPQVTVTAKSSSAGEDELLYRFVNGQLVQSASVPSSPSRTFLEQKIVKNEKPQKSKVGVVQEPEAPKKTKTQLKKEKKQAKLLEQNPEVKSNENEQKPKKNKKADLNANTTQHNRNKSEKTKKEPQTSSDPERDLSVVSSSPEVIHKIKSKVIDNGQFDNNQFKMLHMDDFESDGRSDMNSSVEERAKEVILPKLKLNSVNKDKKPINNIKTKLSEKPEKQSEQPKKLKKDKVKPTKYQELKVAEKDTVPSIYKESSNASTVYHTPPSSVFEFYQQNPHHQPKFHQTSQNHYSQKQHYPKPSHQQVLYNHQLDTNSTNVSIMDQLNRGIQVENLTLPPGITLTKIDPSKAEALRAKTESIGRLSKPIEQIVHPQPQQPPFYPHIIAGGFGNNIPHDQSGIIMVDALSANKQLQEPEKMSKNKKRKNKKKPNPNIQQHPTVPQMVTLKNPMFHGPMVQNPHLNKSLPQNISVGGIQSTIEQPAKIIKNENGMFTIRRSGPEPAPYQNKCNGLSNSLGNYSHFSPRYFPSADNKPSTSFIEPTPVVQERFSPFSSSINHNYFNSLDEPEITYKPNKCISAIGSEIKNAQQQKKAQEWIGKDNCCSSSSSSNNNSTGGFMSATSSYYNGFDSFPSTASHSSSSSSHLPPTNCGSLFDDIMTHHNCDDSPPPSVHEFKPYLDGIQNTGVINYNDASILKHLMPGLQLNNEVSIHNINESNFPRNNATSSPNRVDITPIFGHRSVPTDNDFRSSSSTSSNFIDFQGGLFSTKTFDDLNTSDGIDDETFKNLLNPLNTANFENNISSASAFLENATLDSFVQNIKSLNIGDEPTNLGTAQLHSPEKLPSWW